MNMILTFLWILIVAAIIYGVFTLIPLPQPWKNIALAIMILLALVYFLPHLGFTLP